MPSQSDLGAPTVVLLQTYLRPCRVPLLEGLARQSRINLNLVQSGATLQRRHWGPPSKLDGVEVHQISNLEIPVSYEKSFFIPRNLQRTLNEIDPDVVIGSFDPASLIASAWSRRNGRRFIIWSEETPTAFNTAGRKQARRLRRWARRLQFSRASACIVPGQQSHEHISSFGYRGPIFFAPNSIENEAEFAQIGQVRSEYPSSLDDGLRILFSGSLVARKGIDVLVENWEYLTEASPRPVFLEVAGTGPLKDKLQNTSHPGVLFRGHLSGAEYLDAFRRAHAFILPSRFDCNPLVVIEALWAGLPLIVSEGVGSWPEAVGENGVVLDFEDLGSLRGALLTLSEKTPEEIQAASLESAARAQGFSVARAIDGFREAVEHVL